jgi:hypothetical protein
MSTFRGTIFDGSDTDETKWQSEPMAKHVHKKGWDNMEW